MNGYGDGEHKAPPGFEFVRFDPSTTLLVPMAEAAACRAGVVRRVEEARQEEQRQRMAARDRGSAEEAKGGAKQVPQVEAPAKAADAEPELGYYRVLRNWAELTSTDAWVASLQCVDSEVNARNASLRKRLVQYGPDRRIARPEGWRESVDELEASLPHFRAPIRLLRNTLALADATGQPVRVPPMLLLGPPGVGKTYFTHRVAELMGAPHASIAFDQPSGANQLRGSDKHFSNSSSGMLFNLICLGECANPVILLDELDKSAVTSSRFQELDPLAQLHGVLEPETARRTLDISTDIEFDASLVTYIATANSVRGVGAPILSRLEIFNIEPPETSDGVEIARAVVSQVLKRMNLQDRLGFDRKGLYLLAHLSPRLMLRTAEKAVAAAVAAGQGEVTESDLWAELGPDSDEPRPH